jgi:hypothetical protein
MRGYVEWIGAQADDGNRADEPMRQPVTSQADLGKHPARKPFSLEALWQEFPAPQPQGDGAQLQEDPLDRNPDLWLYRSRTVALLRRYLRFSLETGRLPSFVGREFFRARVTSYGGATFEDRVIFVRDVEMCLSRLQDWDQQLITRVILQEHPSDRAARILQCCRRTVERRLFEVLDLLSEDFLRVGLLDERPGPCGGR